MTRVHLVRLSEEGDHTRGVLLLGSRWLCCTMEPPWHGNAPGMSCIPAGDYIIERYQAPMHGAVFRVAPVPGRDEILVHVGNYPVQTKGCILVGEGYTPHGPHGRAMLTNSAVALETVMEILRADEYPLTITAPGDILPPTP